MFTSYHEVFSGVLIQGENSAHQGCWFNVLMQGVLSSGVYFKKCFTIIYSAINVDSYFSC